MPECRKVRFRRWTILRLRGRAPGPASDRAAPVQAVLLGDDGSFEGFALEDGSELRARAGVLGLQPQGLAALHVRGAGAERLSPLIRLAARLQPSRYVSTMLWFDRKLTRERFWSLRQGGPYAPHGRA